MCLKMKKHKFVEVLVLSPDLLHLYGLVTRQAIMEFGSISTKNLAFNPDINAYRPASGAANSSYNLVVVDKDFKYPQVLKSTLAVDQKLPADIIFTVEGTYSKDLHAVNYENVNLPSTGV